MATKILSYLGVKPTLFHLGENIRFWLEPATILEM